MIIVYLTIVSLITLYAAAKKNNSQNKEFRFFQQIFF